MGLNLVPSGQDGVTVTVTPGDPATVRWPVAAPAFVKVTASGGAVRFSLRGNAAPDSSGVVVVPDGETVTVSTRVEATPITVRVATDSTVSVTVAGFRDVDTGVSTPYPVVTPPAAGVSKLSDLTDVTKTGAAVDKVVAVATVVGGNVTGWKLITLPGSTVSSVSGRTGDVVIGWADLSGMVPSSKLPPLSITQVYPVADQAARLALNATRGNIAVQASPSPARTYALTTDDPTVNSNWIELPALGSVQSINGQQGAVVLAKGDLALGNVDNTADADKPISAAAQSALDGKQPLDADLTALAGLDSSGAGMVASDGAGWTRKTYDQVKTALALSKADVGLNNVNNTADANKPISSATQTALSGKAASDDARLTDQRVPTDGSVTNVKVPVGAAISLDKTADGTTSRTFTTSEKSKLAGVEVGATATGSIASVPGLQAALDGKAAIGHSHGGGGAATGAEFRPEAYAANAATCGDGVTDDTDAFVAMSAAAQAVSAGRVVFTLRPGATYRVGRQTLAGANNQGGSWLPTKFFRVTNLRSVVINGNGARLKFNDGLKAGTFDPVTGAATGTPDVAITASGNSQYVAAPGNMVEITNTAFVAVRDLEIDGNDTAFTKGGGIGVVGTSDYSITGTGLVMNNCGTFAGSNVYIHHMPLDGLYFTDDSTSFAADGHGVTIQSVVCEYNGRNQMWLGGGSNVHAVASKFSHGGRGYFRTAPAAGIDFEAYSPSFGRNAILESCELINNATRCYTASGGWNSISFRRCTFRPSGLRGEFATPTGAAIAHEDCRIYGTINLLGSDIYDTDTALNKLNATTFRRCHIEDLDYCKPVVFLDKQGKPTLRLEATQSYGARAQTTSVSIVAATQANRWKLQVKYNGAVVEEYDNLNSVISALTSLAASTYVLARNLLTPTTGGTDFQPALVADVTLPVSVMDRSTGGLVVRARDNALFQDCTFVPRAVVAFNMSTNGSLVRPTRIIDCTVIPYNSAVANKGLQSSIKQSYVDGLTFVEPPGLAAPTDSWYVSTENTVELGPKGVTVGPLIHWAAWNGVTGVVRGQPKLWGPWAANTGYSAGDVVKYSNALYEAKTNFTSGSSFNASNWTLLTAASGGGGGLSDTWLGHATTSLTPGVGAVLTANNMFLARVLRGSVTASKIGITVFTSSGNISVAVYRNTGTGPSARPGDLAASSGAVACPAAGYAEVPLTAPVDVAPGDWLGLSVDNATATFGSVATTGAVINALTVRATSSHPAPTVLGTFGGANRQMELLAVA